MLPDSAVKDKGKVRLKFQAHPEATAGDEVELFGQQISVTEVAKNAGTISWEILTKLATSQTL